MTLYLAGWIADSLEVLLVSHLLGMPLNWSQALAFEAFISVAKALGVSAPAALAVQESGVIFLFYLFGLPPALGVSYAVIRRARELTFVLIGGLLLYAEEPAMRGSSQSALPEKLRPRHEGHYLRGGTRNAIAIGSAKNPSRIRRPNAAAVARFAILSEAGVRDVVLVTGHLRNQIAETLPGICDGYDLAVRSRS